jgi:hypothetical protein
MINNDADFNIDFILFISNIDIISVKTLVDFLIKEVDWLTNNQKLTFLLSYRVFTIACHCCH